MTEADLLHVLHGLRLAGVAPSDVLAARTGIPRAAVTATLELLAGDGLVRLMDGRLPGWTLTASGRLEGERLLAEELDRAGARAEFEAAYRVFLPLNGRVLALCTDWQVRSLAEGEVPNDHTDVEHDRSVIARLVGLHREALPLLEDLSASLERFTGYSVRLDTAVERTLSGQTDYFTRPSIDSYHSVWFELHEDLLATLGRRRSDEPRRPSRPALLKERA